MFSKHILYNELVGQLSIRSQHVSLYRKEYAFLSNSGMLQAQGVNLYDDGINKDVIQLVKRQFFPKAKF